MCAEDWRIIMGWDKSKIKIGEFPEFNQDGEGMRQIIGKLLIECLCDGCGKHLPCGTQAVAVSLYSLKRPYFEWEHKYIDSM